jgi:hypothetical protein
MCFIHSAVFAGSGFTLPLILLFKQSFVYFTRAWSACYETFLLTFMSTHFAKGAFHIFHSFSRGGLLPLNLVFISTNMADLQT